MLDCLVERLLNKDAPVFRVCIYPLSISLVHHLSDLPLPFWLLLFVTEGEGEELFS